MNEENKQEQQPEISQFRHLVESTDSLTLGRITDIDTDFASGDTILTEKMIEQYSEEEIDSAIERWSSYAVSLDENDVIDRAYLAIAHSKIDDLNLAKLMYKQVLGEDDQSDSIRQLEALIHEHYSPALYHAALKQKIQLLEAIAIEDPSLNVARANLIDELESFLGDEADSGETLVKPEAETLSAVGEWLQKKYGESADAVNEFEGEKLNATQLVDVFNQAIQRTPALRDTGWKSEEVVRKKNAVSTMAGQKKVVVSAQKVSTKKYGRQLVVHEVFGHALRSANAELAGNEAGAIGTATYSTFEESFLIGLEQCLNGTYDPERGLNHYIAAGLVVTDGQSADKITQIFASIKQLEKSVGGFTDENITSANNLAVTQLSRTFAGLTDVDPGIAHLKDINYLHGLDGTWKILNTLTQAGEIEEGMQWLLSAKFNPFDKTDRDLVNSFTAMPPSLVKLFEKEDVALAS